ncbi:Atrial natriuretic peptide receptor 1-like protein [Daphnia magna]|uniref:guanylate cyclase n=1 Tax=Daphnia magna TaxID=35525 RepID=A0A164MR87_9CRUS|nr:Atrial natriuretic peptide receptor 1-like protein [Daphnia magna]
MEIILLYYMIYIVTSADSSYLSIQSCIGMGDQSHGGSSKNSVMEAALNGSLPFNTILEIQNFSRKLFINHLAVSVDKLIVAGVRGGFISFDANGDTEDGYIAVGSSDLFPPKPNSSIDVHKNVMVPFGFFRGTMFHPTAELNHTLHARFASSESSFEDQVIYDVELLNDNVNMTMMLRVMNHPVHPNKLVDDWRMKVWNKSIKWKSSWPALECETIGEIRQVNAKTIQHDNIYPFICAIVEPARICIITEFQSRKSLMDALSTTNNDLNCKLIACLALELAKGMLYIRSSDLRCHGNLKSANCLLDSNRTLKISDFGDLVTGVVGSTIMPTYSIFGDTVSVASRLESTSSELRIQISEASYQELQQIGGYITEERTDRNDATESFKNIG